MAKIIDIEGIGPAYAEKLKSAGIRTIENLLKKGATAASRKSLAEKIGISDRLILKWVKRADMFSVKGDYGFHGRVRNSVEEMTADIADEPSGPGGGRPGG